MTTNFCIADDPIRYINEAVCAGDYERINFAFDTLAGLGVNPSLVREYIFNARKVRTPGLELRSDCTLKRLTALKYKISSAVARIIAE